MDDVIQLRMALLWQLGQGGGGGGDAMLRVLLHDYTDACASKTYVGVVLLCLVSNGGRDYDDDDDDGDDWLELPNNERIVRPNRIALYVRSLASARRRYHFDNTLMQWHAGRKACNVHAHKLNNKLINIICVARRSAHELGLVVTVSGCCCCCCC